MSSEEIREVSRAEFRATLKELKSCKSLGPNQIIGEMLKAGGTGLEVALCALFNKCLEEEKIPEAWQNAEVILLFKKGDPANIANYRPISLLNHQFTLHPL